MDPLPTRAVASSTRTSKPIPAGSRIVLYSVALIGTPVAHALCFPPARIAWLAWVCFVPWFAAIRIASLPTALAITSVTTLLGTYLVASWLPAAVANYYGQSYSVGLLFFVGAWTVTIAPWVWLFTGLYRRAAHRLTRTLPLVAGAAWAGTELLRERLLVGDPFGLFGYSQVDALALVQIADLTGVFGISFLLAAVNAAFAEVCLAVGSPRVPLRQAVVGALLCAGLVVSAGMYGLLRMDAGDESDTDATHIAIVQGNVDPGAQWARESYGRNLEAYVTLTQPLLADGPALVFWPENAMNFFIADEPLYRHALGQLLTPTQAQLVAGGPRTVAGQPPRYYNSVFVVAPDGEIQAVYDKQRLLPFAEYFPLASVELLRREFARVREFTPGDPAPPLPTAAGPAGVLICNEVFYGEIAGERVTAGAGYLLNLANDSWLGDATYAEQAFDMARLRAVEQRRWLVRASTSGPSAIVDPVGRVVVRSTTESQAALSGVIRSRQEITPYGRFGDVFGGLCLILALALLAARRP